MSRILFSAVLLFVSACGSSREQLPEPSLPLVPTPAEDFRKSAPAPEQVRPLDLPYVHRERLPNGLTLILLRIPDAPLAAIRYTTRRNINGFSFFVRRP